MNFRVTVFPLAPQLQATLYNEDTDKACHWLVGHSPIPLKKMKLNGDYYSQHVETYKMFQTTNPLWPLCIYVIIGDIDGHCVYLN